VLNVEPGEYYSIVDKLFASRLVDALNSFGASVGTIDAKIRPEGRTLNLSLGIEITGQSLAGIVDMETVIHGILEKLVQEANSSFGKFYGVAFVLESLEVRRREEQRKAEPKLIVSGPTGIENALRRLGKGLMIKLKDLRIPVTSLTVTTDDLLSPRLISVVLRLSKKMSDAEKETLQEMVEDKARAYARALLSGSIPVAVKVLDPSDRSVARVIERAREAEREIEALLRDEDIKRLMEALGKSPSTDR